MESITKLSPEMKEIQHDILHEIACIVSNYNVSVTLEKREDYVNVFFKDFDEDALDQIQALRMSIIEAGIWFDTGFGTTERYIEWNLDWSLGIAE